MEAADNTVYLNQRDIVSIPNYNSPFLNNLIVIKKLLKPFKK